MEKVFYDVNDLYTPDTIGIRISDLERIEDSASNLSKNINIDVSRLYDKPFWFKYNGKYYYYKEMKNALRLLNELLGVYFSTYMGLESIQYDIALGQNGIMGILSENFREQNKKYIEATDLPFYYYMYIDYVLRFKLGEKDDLKRKINAILVKDIFTCLVDRHANTLCTIGNEFDIGPQFDFEYSLSHKDFCGRVRVFTDYTNPLFIKFPYHDSRLRVISDDYLKILCKRDPQAQEYCEKMNAVDIKAVLEQISDERKIIISQELFKHYEHFYDNRKKTLMKKLK